MEKGWNDTISWKWSTRVCARLHWWVISGSGLNLSINQVSHSPTVGILLTSICRNFGDRKLWYIPRPITATYDEQRYFQQHQAEVLSKARLPRPWTDSPSSLSHTGSTHGPQFRNIQMTNTNNINKWLTEIFSVTRGSSFIEI